MGAKFTEGEWVECCRSHSYIDIGARTEPPPMARPEELAYARVCRVPRHMRGNADAALIKAAPKMYEALKLAATGIWHDKKYNACGMSGGAAVVHAIDAALAAADGSAPPAAGDGKG